jgi:predicted nuclease of predicted toxin-antitoxin system
LAKFIADENIPRHHVKALRANGHDVVTAAEAAKAGARNDELGQLSVRADRLLLTRDADFTRLKQTTMRSLKVIFIRMSGDPSLLTHVVLRNLANCLRILETQNVVILDEDGCYTP